MATYVQARVTNVRHRSDKLLSFTATREPSLRFENGRFIMVALEVAGRRLARACGIASANHENELEFYRIKVPNAPLTSLTQNTRQGDTILLSSQPTRTLVVRGLRPGKRLFLLSTGTGFAPFPSLVKDPEVYERRKLVIVVRGAPAVRDLAYGDSVLGCRREDPHRGELVGARLVDYPTVTREPFVHQGRITTLIESGYALRRPGYSTP